MPPSEPVAAPPPQASLEAPQVDILPARSLEGGPYTLESEPTHPPVRLTPDKSELIRLDGQAASVIVGNPAHLSVLAENASTLVLVPRLPGATFFSALNAEGGVLMQRHVIVAAPKDKYVRIRRSCAAAGNAPCAETEVYYCPDMCHAINIADEAGRTPAKAGDSEAGGSAAPAEETPDAGAEPSPEETE